MSKGPIYQTLTHFQGKPVRRYESPLAAELADLVSCMSDFSTAHEALKILKELQAKGGAHPVIEWNLYSGGVIRYRRCFTTGVRKPVLERLQARLTEADRETHELLMNVADKHLAHSVNAFEEAMVGIQLSSEDAANSAAIACLPVAATFMVHNPARLEQFISHVSRFIALVHSDVDAMRALVLAEAVSMPVERLLARPALEFAQVQDDKAGRRR